MTKISLVRHGLTDFNRLRKLQGFSDIPLNEEGEGQAIDASLYLKDEPFDAIVSSPLNRAFRTAEIINQSHGLPITTMDELKEQHFGNLEGMHIDNIMDKYPDGNLPGIETFESLSARVEKAMNIISEEYDGQYVLLTAHSRTIKSILSLYSDEIDMAQTKLDNCSLSIIQKVNGNWHVIDYNISTAVSGSTHE
ncbi:phosphatase PhoE [Salinicoccus jeotgali]|uniref:Phosphatase PhoE n=1 Tax=Salinicoccus jeotgali TaxID=381634 RepID=A0ABP7ESZ7_9STAP